MFGWLKLLLGIDRYEPIGTYQYAYVDSDGTKVMIITATFFMSKSGQRKIKLFYDEFLGKLYGPKNHQFYHNVCVPFLNKTFPFENLDDDEIKTAIKKVCQLNNQNTHGTSTGLSTRNLLPKLEDGSNIINFTDFNKDK